MLEMIDTALFFFFNQTLQFRALDNIAIVVTEHNEYMFVFLFLFLLRKNNWRRVAVLFVVVMATLGVSDALGYALKGLIARPRPCHALEGVKLLVYCGKSFSMPSNHALNSFAVAGTIFFTSSSRVRYSMIVFAALVAISRPMVGVHYVSDIVVGSILGLGLAWIVAKLYSHACRVIEERKSTPG